MSDIGGIVRSLTTNGRVHPVADPDRAVRLPQAPERGEHEQRDANALQRSPGQARLLERAARSATTSACTTSSVTRHDLFEKGRAASVGCAHAARSVPHRRGVARAPRAHRRRERRPAGRLDAGVGAGEGMARAPSSTGSRSSTRSTRPATSGGRCAATSERAAAARRSYRFGSERRLARRLPQRRRRGRGAAPDR